VVFTQFQLALPLDMAAHGVPPSSFALLMAFNCLGVVLLQPWLTPLLRRFDGAALLAAATLLFGLGYGLNALVSTLPLYLLGAAFWTVGEVVGFPVAAALVADLAPLPLRGRYQGAFSMTWGLGMTLSPIAGGEVIQRLGAPALWGACLATAVLVALGHLAAGGPRRRRLAQLAAAAPAEAVRLA
jgi:MFS family permease